MVIFMIKKVLIWMCLLIFVSAASSVPVEGTHYKKLPISLSKQCPGKVEIMEYFTFVCPSCYKLEQDLVKWLKNKPENVVFEKVPITFGSKALRFQAKGYYIAKIYNKSKEYTDAIFKKIHFDNKRMSSKESILDLLASIGISKKDALETMDSLSLDMQIKNNEEKTIKNRILAMPTFIVDGKYKTDPSIAGGFDQYWHVIDYIIDVVNQENKSGKV